MRLRISAIATIGAACLSTIVCADTLVLRDGRRIDGDLIAVRDGVVEFETSRSFGGRERGRINRTDVLRIEFDSSERGGGSRPNDEVRGDQRPAGLRERSVSVDGNRAWTDTGIDVRSGQAIWFEAGGRVRWGPGREDSPEGEHNSPYNAARPIPSRPGAALIGKVGNGNDYFYIGDDRGRVPVRSSGRLYLGINDDVLQDNSGSFRVIVYY
jgi:hypothetical protein